MQVMPFPDLAASLRLSSQTTTLRAQLDIAGQELTTGVSADIVARTNGALAPIFQIDSELMKFAQLEQDLALAAGRSDAAQTALGLVQDAGGTLGIDLLAAIDRGDAIARPAYVTQANADLERVIAALNTSFGGRSLFGGAAVDAAPLVDAETLKAEVTALFAGAADPAAALAAIDAYFDTPGGGFDTMIYGGSTADGAGVTLTGGEAIPPLPRADAQELREVVKNIAMIAVSDSATFAADPDARDDLLGQAASRLIDAGQGVLDLRAILGDTENQIAAAQEALSAERNTLSLARNGLVGVDQFTAAAKFAELESQLDALYTVTARTAGLSLANYLR